MKTLEQALSLAAIARIEADRARWLRMYAAHVGAEQIALSQSYFDEMASKALTQGLADAACANYAEVC